MLHRFPIALVQVKASNASKSLLNEIRQIMYSLYQPNKVTKNVYNIMNSVKLWNRMDMVFMNFESSKRSDPHGLLLNLSDKINL